MMLPNLAQIHEAQKWLYQYMKPTAQFNWPLLSARVGSEVWVKHENHTPVGAFKLRGALLYVDRLKQTQPELRGVIAATRGNHGQGVGMAARLMGLTAVIVVPHGNSPEKNRAMRALGVELIEHGQDFQEALEYARELSAERGLAMVESFHERLMLGTATYALEFLEGSPPLDRVYVPIGMGSSICGMAAARNALGIKTEIVGVVSAAAPAMALSFVERRVMEAPSTTRIADGLACRLPNPQALEIILANVAAVVQVTDGQIAEAMRIYFEDTHNVAEGAGAAALAAALAEPRKSASIGVVLTGGNVDRDVFKDVLAGVI
jgi:threonine dehydratase